MKIETLAIVALLASNLVTIFLITIAMKHVERWRTAADDWRHIAEGWKSAATALSPHLVVAPPDRQPGTTADFLLTDDFVLTRGAAKRPSSVHKDAA